MATFASSSTIDGVARGISQMSISSNETNYTDNSENRENDPNHLNNVSINIYL
jgi:hypothetical protein